MNPLQIPALTEDQVEAVAKLYRTTHNVRLRTRAQMVLLAVEQHLTVSEIATIVRECEGTVHCWLKRYIAQGMEGLQDAWAGGAPGKRDQSLPGPVASDGAASAAQPGAALLDVDT